MKKISIVLVLVLLISVLGCAAPGVAFAAEETAGKLDKTYVLDDLKNSTINNVQFNPDSYVYSTERSVSILAFAEFGYAYSKDRQGDYAIYVYVYNPSGKEIAVQRNAIGIGTVYKDGKPVDYDKFELRLLSASKDKYANLFYKFRVADASKILTRVSENSNARRYDVSEIELNYGDANSEAFDVGNYYQYSGFAKGYGADVSAESSLSCTSNDIETIGLSVNSTHYRYNNGIYFQKNLQSVYFGVADETLKKYGKLQQIKANWFETQTEWQFVLNNNKHYKLLEPYLGVTLDEYDDSIGYEYFGPSQEFFAVQYNAQNYAVTGNAIKQLDWLFYSEDGNVSTDEVLSYMKTYTDNQATDNLLLDKYAEYLFARRADDGRQYGWQGEDGNGIVIDADSLVDINGFDTGSKLMNWWLTLFYSDLETDDLKNQEPIYMVQESDLSGSNAEIAARLLIDERDVANFKSVYMQNLLQSKKTVLFRFALTDYTAYNLLARKPSFVTTAFSAEEIGYAAKQTVFLDFDIIWLKFVKEGVETVIPTVSAPTDVVSGLTPPPEVNDAIDWLNWLADNWWIFIIIGVLLLLAILAPFVPLIATGFKMVGKGIAFVFKYLGLGLWYFIKYLCIGLYYVIASPVYLVIWIVRKVKERKG